MPVKLLALFLILVLGWAIVESGDSEQTDAATVTSRGTRTKRPTAKAPGRIVEIQAETSEYRLIKHAQGTTKVPLAPTRIVSLSSAATDSLAALGVRPIQMEAASRDFGTPVHLSQRLKGVKTIRGGGLLNLEAVSIMRPDLIFIGSGQGSQNARLYEQFSEIAPTVSIASMTQTDRESRILDVGDVLGMSQQAKQRLEEYRSFLRRAKETLAAHAKGKPIAFLRFRRSTCVIYTQTAMFGPLLFNELGLTPDPAMPVGGANRGWDVLSLERLSKLHAEYIFMVVERDSEIYYDTIAKSPIWRNIPAVKHNHVCRVASGTWIGGDGLLGYEAIVRDVLATIAPGECL